jgi:hypothetical protein
VLSVIYLIFNEGYSATAGEDWMRPQLCQEALRLGRILAELTPPEPEVHGLVALMEIQASRFGARTGPSGEPVLLLDQDRARWDQLLIHRGLAALERAEALNAAPVRASGPYALQATIAACHARARSAEETDWAQIVGLYAKLGEVTPSPRGTQSCGCARDVVRSGGGLNGSMRCRSRRSRPTICCQACAATFSSSAARRGPRGVRASGGLTRTNAAPRCCRPPPPAWRSATRKTRNRVLTNRFGSAFGVESEKRRNALRQPPSTTIFKSNAVELRPRWC